LEASFTAPSGRSHAKELLLDGDEMGPWALRQYLDKYSWKDQNNEPTEVWPDTAYRVVESVLPVLGYGPQDREFQGLVRLIAQRKFIPGGRYLATAGREYHQVNNCMLYRCEDSREGWADVVRKAVMALSSGAGIGVVYSDVRAKGSPIKRTGGYATGPLSPAQMVNEVARHVMAGGFRRSAIWGGLHWWHADIFDWITIKDWSEEIRAAKEKDYFSPAPLDMTNVSVILDSEFFLAYHNEQHEKHEHAQKVYWTTVEHMLAHGEPGFSINVGDKVNECLRNACTEITSEDDSDVCNIGSLNLARIENVAELVEATELATLFLLAGTVYSHVPHAEVERVRYENRRLGLGLMGVHEWLLTRGYDYQVVPELHMWLDHWAKTSDRAALMYAERHALNPPKGRRAIAPNGTTGIVGETSTSGEPFLYEAYKRWYLDGDKRRVFQYVIDPTLERLRQQGVDPSIIETAHSLGYEPEKRIKFQADLQAYVDQGISSTINLAAPITDPDWVRHYGDVFMKYLPQLRGFTCYPNGARGGQPFDAVPYEEALGKTGVTFEDEREAQCASGVCGV
jgi:ribonucleoside-diphosphate reductase alpha chain